MIACNEHVGLAGRGGHASSPFPDSEGTRLLGALRDTIRPS